MSLEEWYKQLPIVTRSYLTLSALTTVACALEIVSPANIYFNPVFIWHKHEVWRVFTNFFYFGQLGLDFIFHMFFLVRYCKSLEEGSFRGRSADFLWMLLLGGGLMTACAPFVATVRFLGPSLSFMLVYVWARRNPYTNLSFLGVFTFTAPFLPWVLLALSVMLGGSPVADLLGMVAGHMYYYLEDVYPRISGRRPLKTPGVIKALFPEEAIRRQNFQAAAAAAAGGGNGGGGGGGGARGFGGVFGGNGGGNGAGGAGGGFGAGGAQQFGGGAPAAGVVGGGAAAQ